MEASQFYGDLQDVCLKSSMDTNFVNTLTLFKNCSKCRIWISAFSTNFCPIKTDLSGNTDWPQALGFQKLAKWTIFGIFK